MRAQKIDAAQEISFGLICKSDPLSAKLMGHSSCTLLSRCGINREKKSPLNTTILSLLTPGCLDASLGLQVQRRKWMSGRLGQKENVASFFAFEDYF